MEQPIEFDLEFALHSFLNSLNTNGILSDLDQDEIKDHLYSEIESLQALGLSAEEAFVISKKKFDHPDLIKVEYQKAKPHKRIIQLLVTSIAIVFGLKMIINLMTIVSFSGLIAIKRFPIIELDFYLKWGDLGVQIFTLFTAGIIGVAIVKRALNGRLLDLWPIPVCFLISELMLRFMYFLSLPEITPSALGSSQYNVNIIIIGMTIVSVFVSFWLIFANRNLAVKFE